MIGVVKRPHKPSSPPTLVIVAVSYTHLGEIIFFNEAEAVSDPDAPEPKDLEQPKTKGKKITGKKEDDLSGLTTHVIPHYMMEQDLIREFGKNGWKQLPDVVTKRYKFCLLYTSRCV